MVARKLGLIFLLVLIINCFSSCINMKGAGKGDSTGYTSFYLGDGNLQYFIKPIELESEKSKFEIDFTIRQFKGEPKIVTANFSVFSETVARTVEKMSLVGTEITISPITLEKIFIEGNEGDFHYRGTSTYDYVEWKTFMKSFKEVYVDGEVFLPDGKTTKQIAGLNASVMQILE